MRDKSLETAVGEQIFKIIKGNPNFKLKHSYTNPNCKNIYVLRFDYCLFFNGSPILLIEVDEKSHFCFPNKNAKFFNTIDNQITQRIVNNEYIKWLFQVTYCLPILHVTEYDHCSSERKLLQYLNKNISIALQGLNLNIFERYYLFYNTFFKNFGAPRIRSKKNELSDSNVTSFISSYNDGVLNDWIEKTLWFSIK